jgi:putative DNA methylase
VISTDPPYYNNIAYADLSDFFYVWLRASQAPVFPDLFGTVSVPKDQELVASPYRHGSKAGAEAYFLEGMTLVMSRLRDAQHPALPMTIYYAFKQVESAGDSGTVSTGWEVFLEALLGCSLSITGTWPVRTERTEALKKDIGALASSIVLVCRSRLDNAAPATRREFAAALAAELPRALADLQRGNVAPVDLAQAAIGPGMAVFSRYSRVVNAAGKQVSVREALALINEVLDEALAQQEGEFDADSRWALAWYEQSGFNDGEFGVADVLARAKNTSVAGLVEAGILRAGRGKVRLLRPSELNPNWDPAADRRRPAWQAVHQLVLAGERGERALAELIAALGTESDAARELAYRLYVLSDRKNRATEAGWYNSLVQSWPEAARLAADLSRHHPVQVQLFGEETPA